MSLLQADQFDVGHRSQGSELIQRCRPPAVLNVLRIALPGNAHSQRRLRAYRRGNDRMDPDECNLVCEYVIEQCMGLNRPLDIRLLVNGCQDYLQWTECQSGCHWRDMVAARVKQRPTTLEEAQPHGRRAQQKQRELEIAAATKDRAERLRRWTEKTEKSEQTLITIRIARLAVLSIASSCSGVM